MKIGNITISDTHPPLVIPEIGINHEGEFSKAMTMIKDAAEAGSSLVKFQCHDVPDEMLYNEVVPGNATETIYNMMVRCAFDEEQERKLKKYTEELGMVYLSTPFSRAAADRLERMGVVAYKIGSGECNNYPLIDHIAKKGKPIILSTGMNDLFSVRKAVDTIRKHKVDYALMHCTSMYPTPYEKVRLGAMAQLAQNFNCPVGLSDHSIGNYTCFAAVALGARIVEKHFTHDKSWSGADIPVSIDPTELKDLIIGSEAIFKASGGSKEVLPEEQPTIDFAYASVVSIRDIKAGEEFTLDNIWVKRPATGEIKAFDFNKVLGKVAMNDIKSDSQIKVSDICK